MQVKLGPLSNSESSRDGCIDLYLQRAISFVCFAPGESADQSTGRHNCHPRLVTVYHPGAPFPNAKIACAHRLDTCAFIFFPVDCNHYNESLHLFPFDIFPTRSTPEQLLMRRIKNCVSALCRHHLFQLFSPSRQLYNFCNGFLL